MNATAISGAAVAAVAFAAFVGHEAEAQDYAPFELACASARYDFTRCEAPEGFWIGEARLIERQSEAACTEGSSWGHDRRAVWVNDGCRGRFALIGGVGGGAEPLDIRCGSGDYEPNYCAANQQVLAVRLVRRRSSATCVEGSSWGWDAGGIWVTNGCRADFRINDPEDVPQSQPDADFDDWADGGFVQGGAAPVVGFDAAYGEQDAVAACQRRMIETAWADGAYSLQLRRDYAVSFEGGWNVSGRAVLFGPRGHEPVDVSCSVVAGEVRALDYVAVQN